MPDPSRSNRRAKAPLSNAEKGAAAAFVASMLASISLFIVYWQGGQTQLEGLLLFVVLGGIGAGIVVWAKRFMPQGPFEEPRGQIASDQADIDAFVADFEEGAEGLARRGFLAKLAAGALAGLGLAAIFPIRSLGPNIGNGLKETPYKGGGLRLVDEQGVPIRAEQLDVDSVITAFPEGHLDAADAPTLLIRLPPGVNQPMEGREGYTAGDLVAYSKLCSHLGCPVGLYQARERLLLCPCHQSTFDVPVGCQPIFGPAARPLPQLPIQETDDGFLVATGDFSDPVGPGFWNRGARLMPLLKPRLVPRLAKWTDERMGAAKVVRKALDKIFPDHWSFMLGEIALYCFVILVATGVFLTFFFEASPSPTVYQGSYEPLQGVEMSQAFESGIRLTFDVRAGLVMRQAHHWAALLFSAAIVAHLLRVFLTGAYRRPREINWVIGLTMMILALINGFFGYSLLDDQLSGSGLRIAYGVVLSIPLIGTWIASLFFGGEFPGADLFQRFYAMHILIVPAALAVLIGLHMAIMIRHKHTHYPGPGRRDDNVVGEKLWPTYAAKAIALLFLTSAIVFLLAGVAQINPIWIYGPYRVADVSAASQPDWYMGWLDGALRIMPPWEIRVAGFEIPNPFFPGVLLPGVVFTVLFLAPWIEAHFTKDRREHHVLQRPRDHPVRTALGVGGLAFYLVLLGAASSDVIASLFGLSVNVVIWIFRIAVIVVPVVVGLVTDKLCRELQLRDRPQPSDPAGHDGEPESEPSSELIKAD